MHPTARYPSDLSPGFKGIVLPSVPLRITCDCGNTLQTDAGETVTCACGRSYDTTSIARHPDLAGLTSDMARAKMLSKVGLLAVIAIGVGVFFWLGWAAATLAFGLAAALFIRTVRPIYRRDMKRTATGLPTWSLKGEREP